MAIVDMILHSEVLNLDEEIAVLLPETRRGYEKLTEKKYPVVYVLHGYKENHLAWIRKSNIEEIAKKLECIVVMPACKNSFYVDSKTGFNYMKYLVEELPIKIANFFPASIKKEDTYIMGASMGGYAAFNIALNNPDKYAAAASFSGVVGLDFDDGLFSKVDVKMNEQLRAIFGSREEYLNSDNYLKRKILEFDKLKDQPRLYMCCGTDDFLYNVNNEFIDYVKENTSVEITYETSSGQHDYFFWNQYIERAFDFFGIKQLSTYSNIDGIDIHRV